MRDARRAFCNGARHIFGSGLAMPNCDPDPAGRKTSNETWWHTFGRKRDEGSAGLRKIAQPFEIANLRLLDVIALVNAGACRVDEWTFKMQSDNAAFACCNQCRGNRELRLFSCVGDECRQTRCRAVTTMRAGDRQHSFRSRLIVEQNPATAVDLKVDESRRQEGSF